MLKNIKMFGYVKESILQGIGSKIIQIIKANEKKKLYLT